MTRTRRAKPERHVDLRVFPHGARYTVSGHAVGGFCFACVCRVVEIGGGDGIALAWCDCSFPEDHHEMEVL